MLKNNLQKKIKSELGASLLIALVVFLAASMVSVVILSASVTAVKRVKDDREEKRNNLALNSCARLVAGYISDTHCEITTITTMITDDDDNVLSESVDGPHYTATGSFATVLPVVLQDYKSGGVAYKQYTIASGTEDLPKCKLELKMVNDTVTDPEKTNGIMIKGIITVMDGTEETRQKLYLKATTRTSYSTAPRINSSDEDNIIEEVIKEPYEWKDVELSTTEFT